MQAILYRDSPYVILWYNINLQAWRTDKWTGYGLVPTGGEGAPFFNLTRTTYQDLTPVAAATTTDEGGSNTGLVVGIVIVVVVVAGIIIWLVRRPKKIETE
jgi:peptide/nickel transport system substrate-binding protein